jgi:methylase of polypeptide subunit release factors
MKGHVPTPESLADKIVRRLFRDAPPASNERILYPGCGDAPFAAAVERLCNEEGWPMPEGLGIETNLAHIKQAKQRELTHLTCRQQDFLTPDMLDMGEFEYIVGNPPYVPIEDLDEAEKSQYRANFTTASGRFDLYLLFFERALSLLAPDGRLSFVTPEKYEYVDTAAPLRRLLTGGEFHVEEIEHIAEDSFEDLITFPCVTTVRHGGTERDTVVRLRDGTSHTTSLSGEESWAANIRNADLDEMKTGVTLGDVTERISPGLATGADKVFVMQKDTVPNAVADEWIHPTVSGRELSECDGPYTDSVFVCPYHPDGALATEQELNGTYEWLADHRDRLEDRSCVETGKSWYAWHETPPMEDILQPKIVFQDIASEPKFWEEPRGDVIPKHSVYYAIPQDGISLEDLSAYLNSTKARMWMEANCQKAHNGFYRLQSRVLADLPVPKGWATSYQATL